MLKLKKSNSQIIIEVPKTIVDHTDQIDSIIAKLQEAKDYLEKHRQKRLEEATQPLWECSL